MHTKQILFLLDILIIQLFKSTIQVCFKFTFCKIMVYNDYIFFRFWFKQENIDDLF